MNGTYDAIVVGARAAGSPTAMLLARKGYRVLLVDRARFPSDTTSTHLIHNPGTAALKRWGLLERLIATGCPPVDTYRFDFGPVVLAGKPRPVDGATVACGPRRTVLDQLLLDAAAESGVEVRDRFSVDGLLVDNGVVTGIRGRSGGREFTETARVVIGADGMNSSVANRVHAAAYNEVGPLMAPYYAYFSGIPDTGAFEACIRPSRAIVMVPTHEGLTCVVGAWPYAEFDANKRDLEANYYRTFDAEPAYAERIRCGKRESRLNGHPVRNFYRVPYGPGWALVGDAGYTKDPCTAQGITDGFRDAESVSNALDEAFTGRRPYRDALREYHRARDEATRPMYDYTVEAATLEPPPAHVLAVLGACAGNRRATEDYLSMEAGALPVPAFFDPDNVARIMGAASRSARAPATAQH